MPTQYTVGADQLQQSILKVLRDCIALLVDINIEVGKLELFFSALNSFIEHLIMPEAEKFKTLLNKTGKRAWAKGHLSIEDPAKQRIYITTLQTKAYFSLLYDIADMYVDVDIKHVQEGMKLCSELSKIAAAKANPQAALQNLNDYNERAVTGIEALVKGRQKETQEGLKQRLVTIRSSLKVIEDIAAPKGLQNTADPKALKDSKHAADKDAGAQLDYDKPAIEDTPPADPKEEIDLSKI